MMSADNAPRSDWLFCGLVRAPGLLFSDPMCFGMFELTRREESRARWETELRESAAERGAAIDQNVIRARCFFMDSTFADAYESGVLHAREVVGLLPMTLTLTPFEFVHAGFLGDLRNGHAQRFPPTRRERLVRRGGITATMDDLAGEPTLTLNTLLVTEPDVYGEIGAALRRSTHWQNVAAIAGDTSEELLALWMACETLTRENEGEVLTAKFVSALGFPKGIYGQQLEPAVRERFFTNAKIVDWTRQLSALFETMRKARNKIAHAGYRGLDLPEFFDRPARRMIGTAMRLLLPRLQRLALAAMRLQIRSVAEMWARFGAAFMLDRIGAPEADAVGTVIYSLENETPF